MARPDVDEWRRYDNGDFDGLEWPVQEFRKVADYVEELEKALRLIEWGSCDGCGRQEHCPVCIGREEKGHEEGCPIGELGLAPRTPEEETELVNLYYDFDAKR